MKFIYHIRELLSSSQLYLSSLFFSCTVLQLKCMKHALLNSKFQIAVGPFTPNFIYNSEVPYENSNNQTESRRRSFVWKFKFSFGVSKIQTKLRVKVSKFT